MVKSENNLFDFIEYFNQLNTDKYWKEFSIFYGEHELLPPIEQLFLNDGLMGIGTIFDLLSNDWSDIQKLSEIINTPVKEINKIVETKETTGNAKNDVTRNTNNKKSNNYISFDEKDTETDHSENTDSETIVTNNNDSENYTLTRYQTGYNTGYYNFVMRSFKNYQAYRMKIYNDIINMICIQIY